MNRLSLIILKVFFGVLLNFQGLLNAKAYPIYAKLPDKNISRMINKQRKQVLFPPLENHRFVFPKKKEALDFALGNVLGDAYLHLSKGQMCFDQAEKEYSEWKKEKAVSLGLTSRTAHVSVAERQRLDKKTSKILETQSYRFYSRSLFRAWRPFFYTVKVPEDPTYGQGKSIYRKKIPPETLDWLTSPLALAIFYMDDGGVQSNTAYFATGEIPPAEIQILQRAFKLNFDLETTLRISNDVPKGFLIRRRSLPHFMKLVEPFIHQVPCMRYKLDFENQQSNP